MNYPTKTLSGAEINPEREVSEILIHRSREGLSWDVAHERVRAHRKHLAGGNSMEVKDWTHPIWLPVLVEEVGEVARAQCDETGPVHLREELVQVAAMALAWVDAIDRGTP